AHHGPRRGRRSAPARRTRCRHRRARRPARDRRERIGRLPRGLGDGVTRIRAVGRLGSAASRVRNERGQALLLVIGIGLAIAVAGGVLVAYGQALGARGRYQRVADLAAISAARVMRTTYPRLFEPPVLPDGIPNPHYMSKLEYLALARAAAGSAATRNGVRLRLGDVTFPDILSFAPTRVRVAVRRTTRLRLPSFGNRRAANVGIAAKAVAAVAAAPNVG